jgi:hypothetical protein
VVPSNVRLRHADAGRVNYFRFNVGRDLTMWYVEYVRVSSAEAVYLGDSFSKVYFR